MDHILSSVHLMRDIWVAAAWGCYEYAAVGTRGQVCMNRWFIPLGYIPRSGIVGHMVTLINISKAPQTVCQRMP